MVDEIPEPEEIELLRGYRVRFDRGLTNAQVFGTYAELASILARKYGLRCGVQSPSDVADLDGLLACDLTGLLKDERAPRECGSVEGESAGSQGPVEFELLIPNFDDLMPAGGSGSGSASVLHERLQAAVGAARLPPSRELRIRTAGVGTSTLAKVELTASVNPDRLVAGLAEQGVAVEMLRPARGTSDALAFQPGSINFQPGSINFQPGSINFQPGLIRFSPGSINFQPGSINFQPGSINFQPRKLLPQPTAEPRHELDAFLRLRWEAAMCCPTAGRDVTVAVLDTGIDAAAQASNPLFGHNLAADPWGGSPDIEVQPRQQVVDDVFGHGTHVAGLVARRAPFARIDHESVRADGTNKTDAFELARDLPDVDQADIFVFSFASPAGCEREVPALHQIVDHLLSRGKVVVAAAGAELDLEQPGDRLFPADFRFDDRPGRLISVGAVDANGEPMTATRKPPPGTTHVVSYGVGVVSAFPSGNIQWGEAGPIIPYRGWARWTGTSMAAPRVAGAIAHLYQTRADMETVVDAADATVAAAARCGGLVR